MRASGIESTSAPTPNAALAHDHGTRVAGARNMRNPVLIPSGGATILRVETGVLVSRTRHAIMTAAPSSVTATMTTVGTWSKGMALRARAVERGVAARTAPGSNTPRRRLLPTDASCPEGASTGPICSTHLRPSRC